jgi:aconitate hydratase
MLGAGLVAKKAAEKGLTVKPWVKTSLAPGSRVVTSYLEKAGLDKHLDKLGFQTVGYGCTTCIGNSGPLPDAVSNAVTQGNLVAAAVLSGNRNFEGRVHPLVKANYLASPPLVVAYAIAGTVDINLATDPLGTDTTGKPVYLKDIWPTDQEVRETVAKAVTPEMFRERYGNVFAGSKEWQGIKAVEDQLYNWDADSTYIQEPPFFVDLAPQPGTIGDIKGARVLCKLGDSITTDHISPAGSIKGDGPAGKYLTERGIRPSDFNSYGSRRGNDRVMTRGTFANIRIRNQLAPGTEGGVTTYLPTNTVMPIFDAAEKYKASSTPLIVLAGVEYGSGSSRDWAAKGVLLLGVNAVIAASFERIHRSNLVGMGVLPLQFMPGDTHESLGLTGRETFDIVGITEELKPLQTLTVVATGEDGSKKEFKVTCRIDTPVEVDYYKNGGILQTVLRAFMKK